MSNAIGHAMSHSIRDAIGHAMREAIGHGKGNSLSPDACALIPVRGYSIHDRNWRQGLALMDGQKR